MIKKEKGITLVSLIITIMVLLIISSTTIYVSLDRFKINNFSKMKNDIIFLDEKVSNYYLKYGVLPILRKNDGSAEKYTYTSLEFKKNSGDNGNYYILDLNALDGLALNYGEEGFKKLNKSSDLYIINERTHTIYYVRGVELNGELYHYLNNETNIVDNIPPTKPEIKVISGTKNDVGNYTSEVQVEIIPGKDNVSGIEKTTYTINDGEEVDITTLTNNIYTITEKGTFEIKARSYDKKGNISEYYIENIKIIEEFQTAYQKLEYIESTGTQYIDTMVKVNSNISFECSWEATQIPSETSGLNGAYYYQSDGQKAYCFGAYGKSGKLYLGIGSTTRNTITAQVGKIYTTYGNNSTMNTNALGNVEDSVTATFRDVDLNFYLFACNTWQPPDIGTTHYYSYEKIYYCKIWNNGELVRNLIPCKRKSDGKIGLYDTVNDVFYENAATSGDDFVAGPEVE